VTCKIEYAKLKYYGSDFIYYRLRNAYNTLCNVHLLGEINIGPTTFSATHFQSVRPTLISSNKTMSVRERVGKRVFLDLL
jgi:hypothetical protein